MAKWLAIVWGILMVAPTLGTILILEKWEFWAETVPVWAKVLGSVNIWFGFWAIAVVPLAAWSVISLISDFRAKEDRKWEKETARELEES